MEERYHYMWIGAMDGEPSVDNLISDMKQVGYHKIVLMPFMIVDGKHARKDMASDAKDSWKSRFQEAGIAVRIQMQGLGEIEGIRKMYVDSLEKIC